MRSRPVAVVVLAILFAIQISATAFAQSDPGPSTGTKPAAVTPAPGVSAIASPGAANWSSHTSPSLPVWTWMQALRLTGPSWSIPSAPVFTRVTYTASSRFNRGRSTSR